MNNYNVQIRKFSCKSKWPDIPKIGVKWSGTKMELAQLFMCHPVETVKVSHPASHSGTYFDNWSRIHG